MKNIIKNPILLVILSVVAIIIVAAVFKPAPAEKSDEAVAAVLTGEIMSYDFGSISMAKGKVSYDFKVKNTTAEKVEIKKMYTSCMCTEALFIKGDSQKGPFGMPGHGYVPPVNEPLEPGEEAIVRAIFDPAAHGPAGVGLIQRAVYLEGEHSKLIELQFSAT